MVDMPSRRRGRGIPADLGAILAEMARGSDDGRLRHASVGAAIADAVGPYLARRLTRVDIDGHRCSVEMADPVAAAQLARHVPMLLDRLRRRLGAEAPTSLLVRRVAPARPTRVVATPAPAGEPAPQRPLTERALATIDDTEDRDRLERWTRGRR